MPLLLSFFFNDVNREGKLTCDVLKELVQHPCFPIVGQDDSRNDYKLTLCHDYPYRHFPRYVPFPLNMESA